MVNNTTRLEIIGVKEKPSTGEGLHFLVYNLPN